jgi:cytidine deaminase
MRTVKKESEVKEYDLVSELSEADQALLAEARQAMEQAYAPYSRFLVGCALQLENGVIIKGSNQENMAYPSGLCAERVAILLGQIILGCVL